MNDTLHENDVHYLRTYANLLECQLEKVTAALARTQSELQHLKGEDVVPLQERIAALTRENIQDVFRRYFPLDRYTVVTLLPEKK